MFRLFVLALDGRHWSDKVESRNFLYKVSYIASLAYNRSINLFLSLLRSIYLSTSLVDFSHTKGLFQFFQLKWKKKRKRPREREREREREKSSLSNSCGAQSPFGQSSTFTASDPLPPTKLLLLAQTWGSDNDNDNNNNNNNCLLLSEAEIFHVTQAAKNTRNRLLGSLELIFNSIEGELFRYIIVTNVPKRNGRLKMFWEIVSEISSK